MQITSGTDKVRGPDWDLDSSRKYFYVGNFQGNILVPIMESIGKA
jgi:hypothetical protein